MLTDAVIILALQTPTGNRGFKTRYYFSPTFQSRRLVQQHLDGWTEDTFKKSSSIDLYVVEFR